MYSILYLYHLLSQYYSYYLHKYPYLLLSSYNALYRQKQNNKLNKYFFLTRSKRLRNTL